jgi:hypothetical protein
MRRTLYSGCSLLFAVVAVFLSAAEPARAQQRQALQTHATAPVRALPMGRLPAAQHLQLAISLPLRNQEQLNTLLQELYDPNSPSYHHFLTVKQFTDQFGPDVVDYQRVVAFAQTYGLKVTRTFGNRLVVDVSGPVAAIESAFHVRMYVYRHPTEKRTFFAPDVEPTVEAGLPMLTIDGLSSFSVPHPMLKWPSIKQTIHSNTSSTCTYPTGSGPGCLFLGSDFRTAYGGGTALDGTGQVLGLIEIGPYRLGSVFTYFNSIGQAINVPIINVASSGVDGVCDVTDPGGGVCDDGEEAIDIEQIISMAPNASALIVYEAYTSSSSAINAYAQAASDNLAKSLSISFGWGGTPSSESGYEQIFQELAAQGQSSFVASGDAGSNSGGSGYPGNSPNITDAGGTDLVTAGPGGAWQSETGWVGSGGGWNTQSPVPTGSPNFLWDQSTAINSTNNGDPSYRNIPDVSAQADTVDYFCANYSCGGVGGTSLAAPRWAGFVALINQQAASNATSTGSNMPLGFLNPLIYPMGTADGATYGNVFHDITSGSNASDSNPPLTCTAPAYGCLSSGLQGFNAEPGLDFVTGWGTPNGPTAFTALFPNTTNANFSMAATNSPMQLTPGNGGTSSISVTPLHGFNAATNLAVVIPGSNTSCSSCDGGAPAGLTANLSASSIPAGGGPVTLTVSTTSSTPGGTYLVGVVGTSGNLTQTAYVTVELPAFVGLGVVPAGGISLNQGSTANATVNATVINGFTGTITSSQSNPPAGVTAQFGSFSSVNSTTMASTATVSATSTAGLTGAGSPDTLLISATTSGFPSQNANLRIFVNPPTSGGSGTPVDLSSAYNVHAFYDDADETSITATNSLDGVGYAFSANLLGAGLNVNGTQFNLGPANQANAVANPGKAINLPAGIYTTLQLLATGIEGNQASQPLVVTYADGSLGNFTQSFSDWCSALNGNGCVSTGSNPGESVAVAMPYRDSAGGQDDRVFYLYHYSIALNQNVGVSSLTLPNNRDVVVLAATLTGPLTTGFSLSASPNPVSVAQGNNGTSTITVTPTGAFTGNVTLAVTSTLPSGVTAAFNPTSTATTSTLTLTAASTAATGGPTAVTITGTSGSLTKTATLNLTVTAPSSFALTAGTPNPATVSPGGSSQASVTVTPANGFTGSVTLTCSIAPAVAGSNAPACSFGSTSPVSISSSSPANATLTFTTVGSSASKLNFDATFYALFLPMPGLMLIGMSFGSLGSQKRRSRKNRMLSLLALWIVLAGLIVIPACGGSGNHSGGGGGGNTGTPAGTYTITINSTGGTQTGNAPTVSITVN